MSSRNLLITVDTELSNFPDAQGLWGRVGHETWGLKRMLDEFDDLGVKGTFFLDVYGREDADVSQQRLAAELIASRDHDLQLHTHPAPAFDARRARLRDYAEAEQADIITFGLDRIEQWTGKRPVLHRAGDWGADNISLRAMARAGIKGDFSASPWSSNCGIVSPAVQCNGWARIEGLLSGLGTCFRDRLTGRVRRVDIGGTSFPEVLDILSRQIDPFILTLHSFSLMRFDRERTSFSGDSLYLRRMRDLVRIAQREHGYELRTAAQAAAQAQTKADADLVALPLATSTPVASAAGIFKSIRGRIGSYSV